MSEVKKAFKHSSYYLAGRLLIKAGGLITLPILTRMLSVGDYGLLGLVSITVYILVAVAKFGSQQFSVRFYSEYKAKGQETAFYTTLFVHMLLFLAPIALICALLGIFNLGPLPKYLLWFVAALGLTEAVTMRCSNIIRAEQNILLYNTIFPIGQFAKIGLGLFLMFYFSKTVGYYLGGQIITNILLISALIYIIFIRTKRLKWSEFSPSLFKESLSYGLPLFILEMSSLIFHYTDRYLIEYKLNTEALAIYTVGANISEYIQEMIFLPVSLAVIPLYMELWTSKGKDEVQRFLSRTTDYVLAVSVPVVFGIYMLNTEIVTLLASGKYAASASVMPLIITGSVIWGFYEIFAAGLYIYKETKRLAAITIFTSVFNLVLNLLLIPRYGIMGSAASLFASYVIMTVLVTRASFKYVRISFDLVNIAKYLAASAVMAFAISLIKIDSLFLSLTVKIAAGAAVYGALLLAADADKRETLLRLAREKLGGGKK